MPGSANISTCLLLLGPVFLISMLTSPVQGHGSMLKPFTWIDAGGRVGMTPFKQCRAGSELPVTDKIVKPGISCFWFTNNTFVPEPTLDPSMSSFPQKFEEFSLEKHPWTSPGSAPIYSPCGAAGGNPYGCPEGADQELGDFCEGYGYSYGPLAEDYYVSPGFPDVVTTEWKAGAVVEAAWGMDANHGGGYAYRLCKVPKEGMGALTEECFQQGHLEFFGNMQAVQYGENVSSRVEFEAHRTKEGTFPRGSQWTRNPIPNCLYMDEPVQHYGNYTLEDANIPNPDPECKIGTQFPAPAPGLLGSGSVGNPAIEHTEYFDYIPLFGFSIVDQLKVPSHLTPGDYVLSFRWDCEQNTQIYNQCANIKIVP